MYFVASLVLLACVTNSVLGHYVKKTGIKEVTDETRYSTLHPNATYRAFKKIANAKGNILFALGDRVSGDDMFITYLEQMGSNTPTDVEVSIWYPDEDLNGPSNTITRVEIVTELTSKDCDAFFVNGGGIFSDFAEILIAANNTESFAYQIYYYGFSLNTHANKN